MSWATLSPHPLLVANPSQCLCIKPTWLCRASGLPWFTNILLWDYEVSAWCSCLCQKKTWHLYLIVKKQSPAPRPLGWVWTSGGHNLVLIYYYISTLRLLFLRALLCRKKVKENKITNNKANLVCKQFLGWCMIGFHSQRLFYLATSETLNSPISPQLVGVMQVSMDAWGGHTKYLN